MPVDLIVMRLADMFRVHPEQDNTHVCSKCGEQVGIYPSGQEALRRMAHLGVRIICAHCTGPVDITVMAPGSEREPFESVPARQGKPLDAC